MLEAMSDKQNLLARAALKVSHWARRNTTTRSRENISAHYDLGNDFFSLFLDPSMMYSSAVYPTPDSDLAAAAQHKLRLICEDLELTAEDHLVEIDWLGRHGDFRCRTHGCRVTTTTISAQFDYTVAAANKGLQDRITVLFDDTAICKPLYVGRIEMIEAVSHQFYDTYFATVSRLLKPHGKTVIQAITMTEQRYGQTRDSVDFSAIFPVAVYSHRHRAIRYRVTDLQMSHLRDITRDYADTLSMA